MDEATKRGIAVLVAAAIGLAAYVVYTKGDEDLACMLSGPAAAAVAQGVFHGRPTSKIVGTAAAGAFVPLACKGVVDALIEEPSKEVTLEVEVATGGTVTQTVTGNEVTAPTPSNPPDIARVVLCLGWESQLAYQLCLDGVIGGGF